MSNQPAIGNELRSALVAMVKKRVPDSEVEDIVQQTLADAFASPHAPPDAESFRRWIFGVAKNKVVDYHRRAGRETFDLPDDIAGTAAPHQEQDMLRWAEKHLPPGDDNKATLDWMLREGDGEKLESIAETENLPAPRVRQRVSRLRRHLKQHWAKEVALLATVGVLITGILFFLRRPPVEKPIANEDVARAEEMRKHAIGKCDAADFKECLIELDEAKKLDPAGDAKPAVQQAREGAKKALALPPSDSSTLNNITPPPTESTAEPVAPVPTDFSMSKEGPSKVQSPKKADGKMRKPIQGPSPAKPSSTDDFDPMMSPLKSSPAPAPNLITPSPKPSKSSGMKGSSMNGSDFGNSIGESKAIGANSLGKVGVKSPIPSSSGGWASDSVAKK